MDGPRFDGFTRALATGTTRRRTLQALAASAVASLLGSVGFEEAGAACVKPGKTCQTPNGKKKKCCKGAKCQGSTCKCKGNKESCGKQCVNLNNDESNCGRCGEKCPRGSTCQQGACENESCPTECCADSDCPGLEACAATGSCFCPTKCCAGKDCPGTEICSANGTCFCPTECCDNSDCPEPEVCSPSGACICQTACCFDSDCPGREICAPAGTCVCIGDCCHDSNCAELEVCSETGTCICETDQCCLQNNTCT